MCRGASGVYAGVHGGEEVVVSSFFDRALPRRDPNTVVAEPDDQVSYRLVDERLERRERARRAAQSRTGDRRDR